MSHVRCLYFSVQLGDEIGSGFFGVVRKATDSSTGEVLAVKALKSTSLIKLQSYTDSMNNIVARGIVG